MQLSSTIQCPLEAFKAACYFSRKKVHEILSTASSIGCLKAILFLDKDLGATYLAKVTDGLLN